jgi:cellulose biosynthesis protein BcsQ
MSRVIAVANHKGGVGKTTTTFNLAGLYAGEGKRVLACDLDPQASLTKLFGFRPESLDVTIADLLLRADVGATASLRVRCGRFSTPSITCSSIARRPSISSTRTASRPPTR